jgi:hypothetical protein
MIEKKKPQLIEHRRGCVYVAATGCVGEDERERERERCEAFAAALDGSGAVLMSSTTAF